MCCPDRTHFRPIQFCSRSLTEAGANILGVVVNDIEMSSAAAFTPHSGHGYRKYGYGYGYGYRPKKKGEEDETGPETLATEESADGNDLDDQAASSETPQEFADDE